MGIEHQVLDHDPINHQPAELHFYNLTCDRTGRSTGMKYCRGTLEEQAAFYNMVIEGDRVYSLDHQDYERVLEYVFGAPGDAGNEHIPADTDNMKKRREFLIHRAMVFARARFPGLSAERTRVRLTIERLDFNPGEAPPGPPVTPTVVSETQESEGPSWHERLLADD
jgi:hypothetical protein